MTVRVAGVWKTCYMPIIRINITADAADVNLFSLAGSPTIPVMVLATIATGVNVYASSTANAALTEGAFPAGSIVRLVNNGTINGMGGVGGNGGAVPCGTTNGTTGQCGSAGTAGSVGGTAVSLSGDIEIDNTNGNIFGGGGGGGAGASWAYSSFGAIGYKGGGGGGGAGGGGGGNKSSGNCEQSSMTRLATNGSAGTSGASGVGGAGGVGTYQAASSGCSAGYAGDGGVGGAYGATGADGKIAHRAGFSSGGCLAEGSCTNYSAGGAPGNAISLNGHTVAWIGGNNSVQVKGAVA